MSTATKKAPAKAAPKPVSDVVEIDDLAPDVDQLRKVNGRLAKLEAQKEKIVKALKERLGEASYGTIGGERAVSWATTQRKVINQALLKERYPDVVEAVTKVSTVRTFTLVEVK